MHGSVMIRAVLLMFLGLLGALVQAAEPDYAPVRADTRLVFPSDHGAHPEFRTEWWYITAWLRDPRGREFGAQITFFRHRPGVQEANPSRFAPTQLVFAHAAVSDLSGGRLLHDQRSGRAGFGLTYAKTGDTDVRVERWGLRRAQGVYLTKLAAARFDLDLRFEPTQSLLLQGRDGYSRKGPDAKQASHYYSLPHLAATGRITVEGTSYEVAGKAWLDHEWSSEILAQHAVGWDWTGINLADGGALMAFRLRDAQGGAVWASATLRQRDGVVRTFSASEVAFTTRRLWRSARTGANYPVQMMVRVGDREFELSPALEDQELDTRASTGTVYWEGAVRAREGGREVGRGYLELTGYWRKLKL